MYNKQIQIIIFYQYFNPNAQILSFSDDPRIVNSHCRPVNYLNLPLKFDVRLNLDIVS